MKTIHEEARDIPVRDEVDVLVVGAGPAGIMAAQSAALVKGTKVMLLDSRGYLGGNMTIGLPLLGFLGRKGNEIIKGLPLRFVERLRERGQATHHRACPLHVSLTMVDPEGTKRLAWEIMEECGVKVLLYV
ncbi:MAG: FAD-dependent oxidoreductase, partial [Candidatus Cryptobacteroides sp.]|nr:FAD-dependent oxidoreductase [Candidatus Cryptobacteroides sp.]